MDNLLQLHTYSLLPTYYSPLAASLPLQLYRSHRSISGSVARFPYISTPTR